MAVQGITQPALISWAAGLKGVRGQALAAATRRRAVVVVKAVMAHAQAMRWIETDPAAATRAPEQHGRAAIDADDVWTPADMRAFLDHVSGHRLAGCFALSLLGLRREEIGGLRWADVDLDAGVLSIRHARMDVNGRDVVVPVKTRRSERELPLPGRERALLAAMAATHSAERKHLTQTKLAPDAQLLSRADGTPLPARSYSQDS